MVITVIEPKIIIKTKTIKSEFNEFWLVVFELANKKSLFLSWRMKKTVESKKIIEKKVAINDTINNLFFCLELIEFFFIFLYTKYIKYYNIQRKFKIFFSENLFLVSIIYMGCFGGKNERNFRK